MNKMCSWRKHAKPGEKLALQFQQKGELITTEIMLGQDPRLVLVQNDRATAVQIKRRHDWLASQAVNLAVM